MTVMSYSQVRNNLKSVLDDVSQNYDITVINRRDGSDAVVMSLEYFNSLMETLHLLKSPANLKHLEKSIKQYHNKELSEHELLDE